MKTYCRVGKLLENNKRNVFKKIVGIVYSYARNDMC